MGAFVVAYLGGWLAVCAYIGWLKMQNADLSHRLDDLEGLMEDRRNRDEVHSTAA